MARSEIIETERLRIIPFFEEYLTRRYVNWLKDSEVTRFSEQRFKKHDAEPCRQYMLSFEGTPNYFWVIVTVDPLSGHIGNIHSFVDANKKTADIDIMSGITPIAISQ